MGVYIEGMEMPIDGNETIIRIQPDGTVLDQYGHHLAITAIPVPPHGRLIDANYVMNNMKSEHPYVQNAIRATIITAPTVIPAESITAEEETNDK